MEIVEINRNGFLILAYILIGYKGLQDNRALAMDSAVVRLFASSSPIVAS